MMCVICGSGAGSHYNSTRNIVDLLPQLLRDWNVQSFLDVRSGLIEKITRHPKKYVHFLQCFAFS